MIIWAWERVCWGITRLPPRVAFHSLPPHYKLAVNAERVTIKNLWLIMMQMRSLVYYSTWLSVLNKELLIHYCYSPVTWESSDKCLCPYIQRNYCIFRGKTADWTVMRVPEECATQTENSSCTCDLTYSKYDEDIQIRTIKDEIEKGHIALPCNLQSRTPAVSGCKKLSLANIPLLV